MHRSFCNLCIIRANSLSKRDLCFYQDAYNESETFKKEKEEVLVKLSDMERRLSEGKGRINKLEQDNEKLRRALEQSMTRLNRMSLDSDNYVDRWAFVKPWKVGFFISSNICLMILTSKSISYESWNTCEIFVNNFFLPVLIFAATVNMQMKIK